MLAVIGTLLGIVVGAGLTFLRDRAQWTRDDATAWRETKFKSYEEFLTAAREQHRTSVLVALTISSHARDPEHEEKDFERKGWADHQAAYERVRAQRGTLELVGAAEVIAAADEIEDALDDEIRTHLAAIATIPDTPEGRLTVGEIHRRGLPWPKLPNPDQKADSQHKEALTRVFDAFKSFSEAARQDLNGPARGKPWFSRS